MLKNTLISKIGFLNWAVIPVQDLIEHFGDIPYSELEGEVAISPDVHDVHLVWKYKGDSDIYHEMCSYHRHGDDASVAEFLDQEIGDDSWEVIGGRLAFRDVLDDGRGDIVEMRLQTLIAEDAA